MRFVCDSCRAQYMISDEKVGPKGVKVRCKKCGYVILVRRPDAAAAPVAPASKPPPPPPDVGDDRAATQVMTNPLAASGPGAAQTHLDRTDPGEAANRAAGNILTGVDEDEIGAVFDQVLSSGHHKAPAEADGEKTQNGPALGDDSDDRMSTRVLDADTMKKLAAEAGIEKEQEKKNGEAQHDWFVAIDDKQVGPLSLDKVKDYWNKGEIGPDSLCWRAGFSDWMALSEVQELASVLAPRPQKPVIVAPTAVAPAAAAVVSVPVESAFNAGGVTKTVRSEVQVPLAAAPAEDTSGGWKPSAASALASLVKEEIEALTKPPPRLDTVDVEPPRTVGLLDLPPPEEKPVSNGKANGAMRGRVDEPASRAPVPPPTYGAPSYTSPGFTTYRPPSSRGLIIGIAVGVGVVVLGLVGLIVYLLTRPPPPVVVQPPPPSPTFAQPGGAPRPPAGQPAQPPAFAPGPVATQPSAGAAPASEPAGLAQTPRPAAAPAGQVQQGAAKGEAAEAVGTGSGSRTKETRLGSPERRERAERSERGTESAGLITPSRPEKPSKPIAEPSGGDDEFEAVFGGGGRSEKGPEKPAGASQPTKRAVYVPPPPGGGGDLPETLGQSDILLVVQQNLPALKKCAAEHKAKEPGVSGTLKMRWIIQPSGRTSNVSVVTPEFKATYMAACVGGLIKQWRFPAHRKQGDPVEFPFKF